MNFPTQRVKVPKVGSPEPLVEGREYYLYVIRDIGVPLTRCLFTYGEGDSSVNNPIGSPVSPWADTCVESTIAKRPLIFVLRHLVMNKVIVQFTATAQQLAPMQEHLTLGLASPSLVPLKRSRGVWRAL